MSLNNESNTAWLRYKTKVSTVDKWISGFTLRHSMLVSEVLKSSFIAKGAQALALSAFAARASRIVIET